METISAIIKRDVLSAIRSGTTWLHSVAFFVLFLSIAAFTLVTEPSRLVQMAPALVWLALLLSVLLSFEHIFQADFDDGSLEQIRMSALPLSFYAIAKVISGWILSVIPLLMVLPIISLPMNIPLSIWGGLMLSVLIASPALMIYGTFASAYLTGLRGTGILLALLTLPLFVPILIFGIGSVMRYEESGLRAVEFKALAGLSLIAIAVGIPAITAALKTATE